MSKRNYYKINLLNIGGERIEFFLEIYNGDNDKILSVMALNSDNVSGLVSELQSVRDIMLSVQS